MDDAGTGDLVVRNLRRDLEAQPQATSTGSELQQTAPEDTFRHRPPLHPTGVSNEKKASAMKFYKTFLDRAALDNGLDHCLFICWGTPGNKWAIDVPVRDMDDEVEIFEAIRKRWFGCRGHWRKWLPFYGIIAAKEVKFRFIHQDGDRFVVLVKSIMKETDRRRRELKNQQQANETILDTITDFEQVEFPDFCYFNTVTGVYDHENSRCPSNTKPSSVSKYPFVEFDEIQHDLSSLELSHVLTLCFQHPKYAEEHHILNGLVHESSIYKYSYIGNALRYLHKPRVGDLEISGLYIEEGQVNNSYRPVSAAVVLLTGATVVSWKLHTGDWNTAFALGSFLVGMVAAVATLGLLQ